MYISLDKKIITDPKEISAASEAYRESTEEDTDLLWEDTDDTIEFIELDSATGKIEIGISNRIGFFSIELNMNSLPLEDLISALIKKLNKFKSLMESLK